jgi:hypothetical protein
LIFDDSHQLRTGKHLEGAGYRWLHTHGSAQWAHSFVLGVYRTGDYSFAFSCDPYVREADLAQLNTQR